MKAEFILDVGEVLHMSLLTMFNCFLAEGIPKTLFHWSGSRSLEGVTPPNLTTIGDNCWAYPNKVIRYDP
jgi:hypothetical protein